jgi:hypothetical protein
MAFVAMLAAGVIHVPSATAPPAFDGVVVNARLVTVDPATATATVLIDPVPTGSFARPPLDLHVLAKDMVLYASTINGRGRTQLSRR